jgi:uncharacterized membrane protein YqaE (UPF0057 family)
MRPQIIDGIVFMKLFRGWNVIDHDDYWFRRKGIYVMDWGRLIVAILLPPVAVIDKGCGAVLLVTILWLFGWLPGVIAAILLGVAAEDRW